MSDRRPLASLQSAFELWRIDAAGLAVCALLGAIWYFAGLKPLSDARAEHDVLQEQLTDRGGALEERSGERTARLRQVAAMKTKIDSGKVKLQNVDQLNKRIAEISALAGQAHLRVDELRPGAPVALRRYTTVPVRLDGTGSFPECVRFLHDLHEQFHDTGVVGFELRGEPEAPDKPSTFVLNLVWYADPPLPTARPVRK